MLLLVVIKVYKQFYTLIPQLVILMNSKNLAFISLVAPTEPRNREEKRRLNRDAKRARAKANERQPGKNDARFRNQCLVEPSPLRAISGVREVVRQAVVEPKDAPTEVVTPDAHKPSLTGDISTIFLTSGVLASVAGALRSSPPEETSISSSPVKSEPAPATAAKPVDHSVVKSTPPAKLTIDDNFDADTLAFFAEGDAISEVNLNPTLAADFSDLEFIGDEFLNAVNSGREKGGKNPLTENKLGSKVSFFANVAAILTIAISSLVASTVSSVNSYFFGSEVPQCSVPVINDTGIFADLEALGSDNYQQRFEKQFLRSLEQSN